QTLLKNLLKQPHNQAVGLYPRIHLDLGIGDRIEYSHMAYNPHGEDITGNVTRNSQTIYKYFLIYDAVKGRRPYFEAIQLHKLD
ncbi:MAG: hypothetical protein KAU50_03515, partial [Candidatus Marinimicrobia bacterium]|nr:hypothetical protein [Candidatus Neomarinimicrobiota bacterium]